MGRSAWVVIVLKVLFAVGKMLLMSRQSIGQKGVASFAAPEPGTRQSRYCLLDLRALSHNWSSKLDQFRVPSQRSKTLNLRCIKG